MQLKIRPPLPSDVRRVAELTSQLGYPVRSRVLSSRVARLAVDPNQFVRLAESADGQTLGWIHAAEQDLLESGRRCEILGLVVDSASRRRGVGRALIRAVERWAAQRGLKELSVRTNIARSESHPFYERLGYQRAKTQHVYRKKLS